MFDMVFCLRFNFWPDIAAEWLEKERHWPDPETVCEIRYIGCTLVRKSIGSEENTWRTSFSQAEGILANHQSPFQKKSYFLAGLETSDLLDSESERKLSFYHLKTAFLFTLENTPKEEFEKLEQTKDYLKLAFLMFGRLSQALKNGYVPCLFVPEMNLLHGFSQSYLINIVNRFDNLFKSDTFVENLVVKSFKKARILTYFLEDGIKNISFM